MKKIYLAFLWHHHQPVYKNPSTGRYELPWVRLHATKDYFDTAAILDEFPRIKSNFNLVPSLLVQLDEYAKGTARDRFLDLTLKNADELDEDERVFILRNFFMANWGTMVLPYPRYRSLLEKRGQQVAEDDIKRIQSYFTPAEVRDLQVWFNLSWMDPYWKENDELVKSLVARGRDFTEEQKQALVRKQLEICGRIVGKYRELQDRGQIEVSTTPFYHPILPLLCDTGAALGSTPQMTLPRKRFNHSEDARAQVRKAAEYYARCFGRPPRGMWPAEGSVSEEVIPIFAEAGISWIASDEEVLFRTVPPLNHSRKNLYRPYRVAAGGSEISMIFRDHALSDAIGFVYGQWEPQHAVADFIKRLHDIAALCGDQAFVPVILDGENCWEYYSNDGWDFLRLLYQSLSDDPYIETVTVGGYLEKNRPAATLQNLWPGSWINANFDIWIGHPEDNRAWEYLADTRSFLTDYERRNPGKKGSPALISAWERLYAAEGSDWNWWYGGDHSSANDDIFDFLFRQHLISIYELLEEKVPDGLYRPIKEIARQRATIEPSGFLSPKIDGLVTDYFEWQSAGFYQAGRSGGSMHQVETLLTSFHYGFDLDNLYFRFDFGIPPAQLAGEMALKIVFLPPVRCDVVLSLGTAGRRREFFMDINGDRRHMSGAAVQKIVECAVPIESLSLDAEAEAIEFVVVVLKDGLEAERWPFQSAIVIPRPSGDFPLKNWSV